MYIISKLIKGMKMKSLIVMVLIVVSFVGGVYAHQNFELKCQNLFDGIKTVVTELIEN